MTRLRMITRSAPLSVFTAVVVLGGCGGLLGGGGSSSRPYAITANRDIYSRGNTGEAMIRNVSGKTLEYNLCPRRLERDVNRYWVVAFEWPTAGGACTTEMRSIRKGESVSALFEIPTGVPGGRYRVVFTELRGEDGKTVSPDDASTPAFRVSAGGSG